MQAHSAKQTNAIAVAVQNGELDVLTLWAAVRGYAYRKARRWAAALEYRSGQDIEDLMQEAFLAMLRACGCRTKREAEDPLRSSISLDAPIGEDGEEAGTLVSLVPDESAERPFLGIEQQELADAVQESLQSLPENLRGAMIDAFWYDKPVDAKLRTAALKALRHPTISRTLRTYI